MAAQTWMLSPSVRKSRTSDKFCDLETLTLHLRRQVYADTETKRLAMQRPPRHAACEPCRLMKQACDHNRPVCGRCVRRHRVAECEYRETPFQKRRREPTHPSIGTTQDITSPAPIRSHATEASNLNPRRRDNPGYLGPSSHTALFDNLPTEVSDRDAVTDSNLQVSSGLVDEAKVAHAARVLEELAAQLDLEVCRSLVAFWLGRGTNLTLGGPLVKACVDSMVELFTKIPKEPGWQTQLAQRLFQSSNNVQIWPDTVAMSDLCSQICGVHTKWETLILSLIATARATVDLSYFPPLFTTRDEVFGLQRKITQLADDCLEIALQSGCLGDVLLICQFENQILHTVIDGDQGFDAWRRLGDVISSVLFMGLHQLHRPKTNIPPFVLELRKLIFVRIYSDDKNVAVFLGRPPRLSRTFCHFELPQEHSSSSPIFRAAIGRGSNPHDGHFESIIYQPDKATFATGICWAAACARLKEKGLEIHQMPANQPDKCAQTSEAYAELDSLWAALPAHLKIQGTMRSCRSRTPFEQDLLLNIRLDYLQVIFLLESDGILVHSSRNREDLRKLFKVSEEIFSLVVEAIVRRNDIVNSGTSLVWKVVHFGLPAAGIIALFLLQQGALGDFPQHKIIQDLSVFVAEIQEEGLLCASDPNYPILHRAAVTLQRLLQAALRTTAAIPTQEPETCTNIDDIDWADLDTVLSSNPAGCIDSLGYEMEFWRTIDQHPFLLSPTGIAGG